MTQATVEVVGLTKMFGERVAVRELSFAAHPGDTVGLLGPNGAGAPAFVDATARDTLDAAGTLPLVPAIPGLLGSAAGLARWRFRLR